MNDLRLITDFAERYIRSKNIGEVHPFELRSFALEAAMAGYTFYGKYIKEPVYKKSPVKATVTCEGLVYGVSGFAEALRNVAYYLDKSKVNVAVDAHDKAGADNIDIIATKKGKVINNLSGIQYTGDKKIRIIMTTPGGVRRKDPNEYTIAYIMFETIDFPKNFIRNLKQHCDEIWTPSQFNVDNIKRAGWHKPIFKMPLGVDTKRFNPATVKPLDFTESEIGYFTGKFKFLSIMGWSERKGVKLLMEAYLREFSSKDNVVLYIKGGWHDQNKALREMLMIKRKVNKKDSPMIYLDFHIYPDEMLPRLYKTANAFVLPSRGEGWGLNYTEAMSMELPTIGTYATSMLDFMNSNNSFPVICDEPKKEPDCDWVTPDYIGRKFANPSLKDLRDEMRRVFNHPNMAKLIGWEARIDMKEKFSWELAAENWIKRLETLSI